MSDPLNLSPAEVNSLFPIIGVRVYKRTLRVVRQSLLAAKPSKVSKRGEIATLSKRSLNRFAFLVGNVETPFLSLLTLTYGPNYPICGKRAKMGLRVILQAFRRRFAGVRYWWFLEFQERGAPHFHVGLSVSPTWEDRKWLAESWGRIAEEMDLDYVAGWGRDFDANSPVLRTRDAVIRQHYREGVWENVKSKDGSLRYVLSYTLKPHQKHVPVSYRDVGRFWGISRNVEYGGFNDFLATEDEVRELTAILGRDMDNFEILPKFIFHSGKLPGQEFDNQSLFG